MLHVNTVSFRDDRWMISEKEVGAKTHKTWSVPANNSIDFWCLSVWLRFLVFLRMTGKSLDVYVVYVSILAQSSLVIFAHWLFIWFVFQRELSPAKHVFHRAKETCNVRFVLARSPDGHYLTLEASKKKIVTRSLEGRFIGPPPPSTFDTIHPIDLKFWYI